MAPVDSTFYDLLGVEAGATSADIKHAYRRKALQLHPDKGGDPEQFKVMKEAYDVLSDPQKRELYDQYGPDIVKMSEGNMVSPMAVLMALSRVGKKERAVALLVLTSFALALVSPALLLSLRWDSVVPMSWFFAFIPLWVFQTVLWCCAQSCLAVPPMDDEEAADEEFRAAHAERSRQVRDLRLRSSLYFLLFFALEIFWSMRMEGVIRWSWYVVFSPWYCIELLWIWGSLRSEDSGGESCMKSLKNTGWSWLRIMTVALLATRADNMFKFSWYYCFIPVFVGSVVEVGSTLRSKRPEGAGADEERPSQENDEDQEQGSTCGACCSVGFWLIMACGAAAKLDGAHYSAFLVFAPLFAIVCGVLCVVSTVIVSFSPEAVAEIQRQEEQANLNRSAAGVDTYGTANPQPAAASHSEAPRTGNMQT
eukprot:gb/GFBE01039976.1/.p1 GENE.gb/GFBE01039976.1/~~gb/GFBE01039976.1/.p1  ORF type:complete len:423 (+),score=82.96 gb/GFBE01039976.1/:1-1269(+)